MVIKVTRPTMMATIADEAAMNRRRRSSAGDRCPERLESIMSA
jgi:hypothetical protein